MKRLTATALLCIFGLLLNAQENNPLINSGGLIDKAISLHDEGKYKESIEIYKRIPRGDTNYYRSVYEMALSQMLDSQFVAARQSCEAGLASPNEKWPDLFTLYGNIIDDMGDPNRALNIYDSAIKLYPAYSELYLNKGTTLMKLNRYADAEEIFKQSLLINPYLASSHYKLGACAAQQGRVLQAFLSYINYLLLQPAGRYQANCIAALSKISTAGDDIKELIQKRTEDINDNFLIAEKIMLSKIALDKQYKPLLKLDDPISRQIQVLLEKLEYNEKEPDFWMQYYVPLFKNIFSEKKFEPFINRLFANVKIDAIQDYIRKNKKEVGDVVDEAIIYYNQVRDTREVNYAARKDMNVVYHHDDGKLFGKGNAKDNGETLTGNWEFYYSPGNLRSKGSYNEKGEKNGPWQYYHFDGQHRGKQTYKDDKLEGEEVFYYENGAPSTFATFKNGEEDGESKSYYLIGIPRIIVNYKKGKLNGERRAFFSNGNLQSIENYKEDSLHGPFRTYHKTGPLESEGNYSHANLDGAYKAYFVNGKLSMDGIYSEGKIKGLWKQYHENGKLKLQETFEDGVVEGEYAEYYDNGQLFYQCNYKKGKVSGDVEYFDRDGKRFFIYTLENDITKVARYFDKSGKEVGISERKSKKLDLTTYFSDGTKRSQAVYNDKGEITGTETYFYHSGKPSSENIYEDDQLQGPSFNYHPNGKKQVSTYYKNGERHGYEKFWYSPGQLKDEGWYQDGMTQGTWISYDELGNRSFVTEYLNNDLNGYKEEYYPNGKKKNETRYNMGWIEEFIQFDTTGKEINRCVIKNGNGKFKVVFFNGKTFGEGTYVNGELDGPYKFYFFDGKIHTQQFYKRGELDSIYHNYYYGGQLAAEGKYKDGKKEGVWKNYFASGKLHYTENYTNGEMTGEKKYYFENGKPDTEIEMEKDERNGWTKRYDQDGSLMYQLRFIYGLPVSYTYPDKSGKLLPEIPIIAGTGKIKTFFANGNPSSEFGYADGKLHGTNIAYHSNGKLRFQGNEEYDLSEGNYKHHYANGQLQYDYTFLHENLHGPYKEYNEKGIVTEEGYFYNGQPHDATKIYDDVGKLKETRYYYYGKLIDIKK
jgi:uncharacterized protein